MFSESDFSQRAQEPPDYVRILTEWTQLKYQVKRHRKILHKKDLCLFIIFGVSFLDLKLPFLGS